MRTIYKYPLPPTFGLKFEIEMPRGAKVIHAGRDPIGQVCIWAEVVTDQIKVPLNFLIVGTGHPIPAGAREHVVSFRDAEFMWHLYVE